MTDSASSAISTQAEELVKLLQGKWLAVGGCSLHSHNLTLEVPFGKVFGGSVLGEPSVLCLIRTISWLQQHYEDLEAAVAAADPERFEAWPSQRITDPVMTRWLTMSAALDWWHEHGATIAKMCETMHDGLPTTSCAGREIYGRTGVWLTKAPKLRADTMFCSCFCKALWNPRYFNLIRPHVRSAPLEGVLSLNQK
jgi:hypothetical protein